MHALLSFLFCILDCCSAVEFTGHLYVGTENEKCKSSTRVYEEIVYTLQFITADKVQVAFKCLNARLTDFASIPL
jgi:hypothetical protein